MQRISVVIPARNEERYLPRCLESVRAAAARIELPVEIVVVLNRCTDGTGSVAQQYGAATVVEDARNLARVRNAGAVAATGDVLVTIDADSWMSPNTLQEVLRYLATGHYIGGGVRAYPERLSIGIVFSLAMLLPYLLKGQVSGCMFWLLKRDFEAVGGFDERLYSAEDYYFAIKLKEFGQRAGLKYGTLMRARVTTSCRKFDRFGDWYLFRHPGFVRAVFRGHRQPDIDRFFYDIER